MPASERNELVGAEERWSELPLFRFESLMYMLNGVDGRTADTDGMGRRIDGIRARF